MGDKNQIQSAYILSQRDPSSMRPASSAPPPDLHHRLTPSGTPEYTHLSSTQLVSSSTLVERYGSLARDTSRSGGSVGVDPLDRGSDESDGASPRIHPQQQ